MLPIILDLLIGVPVNWKLPSDHTLPEGFKFKVPSAEEMRRLLAESRESDDYFHRHYFHTWPAIESAVFTQEQVDSALEQFKNADKANRNSLVGSLSGEPKSTFPITGSYARGMDKRVLRISLEDINLNLPKKSFRNTLMSDLI